MYYAHYVQHCKLIHTFSFNLTSAGLPYSKLFQDLVHEDCKLIKRLYSGTKINQQASYSLYSNSVGLWLQLHVRSLCPFDTNNKQAVIFPRVVATRYYVNVCPHHQKVYSSNPILTREHIKGTTWAIHARSIRMYQLYLVGYIQSTMLTLAVQLFTLMFTSKYRVHQCLPFVNIQLTNTVEPQNKRTVQGTLI